MDSGIQQQRPRRASQDSDAASDTAFTDEEFGSMLEAAITELSPSISIFRDSAQIRGFLLDVIDRCLLDTLACCSSRQNVKIRLDMMLKLLVSTLCFPLLSVLLGVGSRDGAAQLQAVRRRVSRSLTYFQRAELELYACHSDEAADPLRVELAVELLAGRCSSIIPVELMLEEHYVQVMACLSCHLLCVRALADDIQEALSANLQALKKLIAAQPQTSSASWQHCTQETSAHFFRWLRTHRAGLARSCRNAEIVQSVDASVRAWLRAEEYASPAAIVRIYKENYQTHLTALPLPWQAFSRADVDQAYKDLCRESVVLNTREFRGADSTRAISAEIGKVVMFLFDFSEDIQLLRERATPRRNSGDSLPGTDTLELLESNVLIAASRTVASGDAFFIVEDLYGGDGLLLMPSKPNAAAAAKLGTGTGTGGTGGKGSVDGSTSSIRIDVSVEGISVAMTEHFNLVSAEAVSSGSLHCPPLVRFRCSTETRIRLGGAADTDAWAGSCSVRSFLSDGKGKEAGRARQSPLAPREGVEARPPAGFSLYRTLLSDPELICQKRITIEPYL